MRFLFRATIAEIEWKIRIMELEEKKNLEREIESKTGGDNWHNPNKVIQQSKQQTLQELRDLLRTSRVLEVPERSSRILPGHAIIVKYVLNAIEVSKMLHICSTIDAQILSNVAKENDSKMLSIESPLGSRLLGKRAGDVVKHNGIDFEIDSVFISNLA